MIKAAHRPRKRFGQNFLQDASVIQKIVSAIQPQAPDHLIEIGPGLGALTKPLLAAVSHLDVIEIDRNLAEKLPNLTSADHHLTIHTEDVLKVDFSHFAQNKPPAAKFRIVGNLPYNISTPLIFHLLKFHTIIEDMHFMLQKEVVDRIIALPNTEAYGRLSLMVQYFCEPSSLFSVPPTAFYPPPQVNSAVIRLVPHATLPFVANDIPLLQNITRAAFSQRRKTVSNALKAYLTRADFDILQINPTLRPEVLSLKEYVQIANYLHQRGHENV